MQATHDIRSSLTHRTVLVADDNEAVRTAFDVLLSFHGTRVLGAASPAEAVAILEREPVDLVIQDMNFRREATSGEEGVALFRAILARRARARAELASRFELCGIVYESDALHTAVSMATQVAHADVPVLITGPNGAGKEVLADIVQASSAARERPYVKVNVGALPEDLIEAKLFGTEAGAFTGAKARAGRFEAADGGTLFLDEIGNLSPSGQAKLLRVLQTGEFERLGSNVTRRTRVRILVATNTDLRQAIQEGRFREDLYYRLNVIELAVPPLAARREDIPPLACHFLEPGYTLAPDAERALLRHGWPGNIRELKNTIRRACLLAAEPVIRAADLGLPATAASGGIEELSLDRPAIELALERAGGIVAHAARDLGLSRQALYRRMEKLGLKPSAEG